MQRMPKRPKRNKALWEFVHHILLTYPAAFPVVVAVKKRRPNQSTHEHVVREFDPPRFRIVLFEIDTDPEVQVDWLGESFCHAYAHVMSWSHNHDQEHWLWQHEETWGVWYSRLYRQWFEDT